MCKDFGPYDSVGTQIKEAKLVDGLAYWEIQEVINNALLEAEITFWTLVAAVKAMQAAFKHKENITFLLKRTQALYNERMATEYDLAQVKRELADSNEQIDRAGNNITVASNRLNELMDAEKNDVFLPIDYTTLLTTDPNPLPDAKAVIPNPALMKQIAKLKTVQLLKRHQQVQVRPDIKFLLTLILSQRHSGFGFDTAAESISKLFTSPDSFGQDYSLVYHYPLFNRAARSALEQAELNEERQQILIDQVRKRVLREINDAVVGLTSLQARIRIARRSLELAQLAYTKAIELQETRGVTEYEVVIKSVDLHNADLDFIIAQIQRKVAEIRLLGAQGKLADRYSNE
jgi:outer membrane protein TolC